MFIRILIWMLNKAFNGKNRKQLEPCIKQLYRRMAVDNLSIKSEIVRVKKGHKRYDLAFFETKNGNLKFNLSRHFTLGSTNWDKKVIIEGTLQDNHFNN